jgi:hypothetical protein
MTLLFIVAVAGMLHYLFDGFLASNKLRALFD